MVMAIDYGFIKISRKMFDGHDKFWEEKRPRTKAEAWIDLIQLANWKNGEMVVNNIVVELKRGEFLASLRYLSRRWGWSKNKVRGFLKTCENMGQIKGRHSSQAGTTYLIVNYSGYQSRKDTPSQEKGQEEGHLKDTQGTPKGQNKEVKQLSSEVKNTQQELSELKQTPDMCKFCAELEKKTGHKQAWNKRYWPIWLKYIDLVGVDRLLSSINGRQFTNVEYLLKTPSNGTEINFLEDLELKVMGEQWQEMKDTETVNPEIIGLFVSDGGTGPTDEQIMKACGFHD